MATLIASIPHCTSHQPIIFDKLMVNIGSGYNSQHGIFKAPVSDVYAFSATLSTLQHSHFYVAIVQGNVTNEIGYLYSELGSDNNWQLRSTTVLSHLNSGEEVWMACVSDSTIQGDSISPAIRDAQDFHSHFSGFLVSED